jgi:hypothetical protein
VLRGVLPLLPPQDAPEYLTVLLEARDRAGMAAVDPIEDEVHRFVGWSGVKEDLLAKERAQRARVEEDLARARAAAAALRAEADRRATVAPAPVATQVQVVHANSEELEELARARARLAELKEEAKDLHAERNRLRRDLEEARQAQAQAQAAAPAPSAPSGADEDDGGDDGPVATQPPRVPVLSEDFVEALDQFPEHVRRGAIELVGRLAAGRPDAFRGAKPLEGMREVWRQRLMRSYRLLFQLEPDHLRVLDLVHRQDLERRLRMLWRQGGAG